jgi:hypothetical protein
MAQTQRIQQSNIISTKSENGRLLIAPISSENGLQLVSQWQREEEEEHAALLRRKLFRERLMNEMPTFNRADLRPLDVNNRGELRHDKSVYFFWQTLQPLQRERVCRALALLHVEGISNATANDMKSALYHRSVLDKNLWNAMLVLLARFNPRDLLLRFGQAAPVLLLDIIQTRAGLSPALRLTQVSRTRT